MDFIKKKAIRLFDLNLIYSIIKDIKDWKMSKNNISDSNKLNNNEVDKGDILFIFGVVWPVIFSSCLITYKTITHYFKWKSLDTESQIKLKQLINDEKQLEYEFQLKFKQLDNEGKQLDNNKQQLINDGKQLEYEFQLKFKHFNNNN